MNAKSRVLLLAFAGLALVAAIVLVLYQIGSFQKMEEALEQVEHFGTPEQIESLLSALPEGHGLAGADATGYNSYYTGLENPNLVLSQQGFPSTTPGTVKLVLGLFDSSTGKSLAPSVLITADEGRYTSASGPNGSHWFLFSRTEGGEQGGGALKGDELGWHWVWPAEGGTEAYADFWSGHLGYLNPADFSIELMAPLGEIAWAPYHTEFFHETVFGVAPQQVQSAAQTYLDSFHDGTPPNVLSLEPQERYVLNETTVDVYRLTWQRTLAGVDPPAFYDMPPAYLVFARPYGGGSDEYEYRGGVEGITESPTDYARNAAIQVVWGVRDAEYAFTRDGYPHHCGLGGGGVDFLPGAEARTQIIDTNGDAIYGVGDYWEETSWDGLSILSYVSVEYGLGPSISTLATTLPDVATYRGVRAGMTREEVLAAYPEASAEPNWGWEGDYLWWQHVPEGAEMSGLGPNLVFYFKDDMVAKIKLIDMFD